jgi:hypothetical protein
MKTAGQCVDKGIRPWGAARLTVLHPEACYDTCSPASPHPAPSQRTCSPSTPSTSPIRRLPWRPSWMYSPREIRDTTVPASAPERTAARKFAVVAGHALPYSPGARTREGGARRVGGRGGLRLPRLWRPPGGAGSAVRTVGARCGPPFGRRPLARRRRAQDRRQAPQRTARCRPAHPHALRCRAAPISMRPRAAFGSGMTVRSPRVRSPGALNAVSATPMSRYTWWGGAGGRGEGGRWGGAAGARGQRHPLKLHPHKKGLHLQCPPTPSAYCVGYCEVWVAAAALGCQGAARQSARERGCGRRCSEGAEQRAASRWRQLGRVAIELLLLLGWRLGAVGAVACRTHHRLARDERRAARRAAAAAA